MGNMRGEGERGSVVGHLAFSWTRAMNGSRVQDGLSGHVCAEMPFVFCSVGLGNGLVVAGASRGAAPCRKGSRGGCKSRWVAGVWLMGILFPCSHCTQGCVGPLGECQNHICSISQCMQHVEESPISSIRHIGVG